jgi:hypothetical protein
VAAHSRLTEHRGAGKTKGPAHDKRGKEGREQNDSHHYSNLRLPEDAGVRAHCCDDHREKQHPVTPEGTKIT